MSGGRIAISGFEYQGIVVLDLLFDHFDRHGADGRVRPEGLDDVDLIWSENGVDCHCHVQVKKPRENTAGVARNEPWRLSEVADELLPNTLSQLAGTQKRQVWILGDGVDSQVERLAAAGTAAADVEPDLYWSVVHRLARATISTELRGTQRNTLLRWRFVDPSADSQGKRDRLVAEYSRMLHDAGIGPDVIRCYQDRVAWSDLHLPDVLPRIEIRQAYGSEAEVGARFRNRLQREFDLPPSVVEDSLFGNLRSFINDVSTDPNAVIDRIGFEAQLRSAWPQMSAASEPPVLSANAIERPDLRDSLVSRGVATVTEVIGISGSGKTTLAAQAAAAMADHEPDRLPIYVRVRHDAALRDVLSGVAFLLLRRGVPELFAPAVGSRPADDSVIDQLANLCSNLPRPVQLLLDLSEGSCNAQFARDLARFARALQPGSCRVVVFGQESSFITLSAAEIQAAGIGMVNMRGFTWNEFARLVQQHHTNVDLAALHDVFRRVTVGGPSGMPAQLADALARLPSLEAMHLIVNQAPEDMVSAAEQSRFNQLAAAIRPAAERLVCFAVPFRRQQAEAAFPDQNVGAAITALVALGLLRRDAEGLLEMHETVRAGLESAIAPNLRQGAHEALADLYSQSDIAAQIFHLSKAGREGDADRLARETFLSGKSWRSLAGYVVRRALVTVEEIANVAAQSEPIDDFYLLSFVVSAQAEEGADSLFMSLLFQQRDRYFADYRWAERVIEVVLALNPGRFEELLHLTVNQAPNAEARREALAWLLIASRRQRYRASPEIINFIRSQQPEVQRQLLPLLLQDGRRDALLLAFELYALPIDEATNRREWAGSAKLLVDRREDVVEILAALPNRPASQAAALRSLGFGALGALLWTARHQLRGFCVAILASDGEEVRIRAMAWRVLLFIGHAALGTLVDPLAPAPIPGDEALLGPVFARDSYDAARFEDQLLDSRASAHSRFAALSVLWLLDVDLGALRSRLTALVNDPLAGTWDTFFLLLFNKQPFAAGIPLLQANLASPPERALPAATMAVALREVAEKPWPEVTSLLLHGVQHVHSMIRSAAAWGLARRRAPDAAAALRAQLVVETDSAVAELLVRAIAASGPGAADDLATPFASDGIVLWQCLVAGRTRQIGYASRLVAQATDTSASWSTRRAAIWSAGRLPFDAALAQIAPMVLAEPAPAAFEHDTRLEAFVLLAELLQTDITGLMPAGEAYFVDTATIVLEGWWDQLLFRASLPAPAEAAQWLYAALASDPSPAGIRRFYNSLHLPLLHAATVRAYGLCGRAAEIEQVLVQTPSVWLATKCMMQLHGLLGNDPNFGSRLRAILSIARCAGDDSLVRVADELTARPNPPATQMAGAKVAVASAPTVAPNRPLGYGEVSRALRGASGLFDTSRPVSLAPMSREDVQRLVALADPSLDSTVHAERFTAGLVFTRGGHVVGQTSFTAANSPSIPERLRPAIAASNRFGLPMPWHSERLRWPWVDSYSVDFLASLGLQGNADRFYEALEADADVLLPALSRPAGLAAAGHLLDDRLAVALHQCSLLGDEPFFESVCILTFKLSRVAAVPVLTGLLQRWVSAHFVKSPDLQVDKPETWRGFMRLSEHLAFRDIADWRKSLERVLTTSMDSFRKQSLIEVLMVEPGSYVLIEEQLAQEEDWGHFRRSNVDALDASAERLFNQTR